MATILIADDQPMNRQYLVTLLGYFGHRLLEASNGEEALRLAKSEHPDLVISDLLMPVVDGQELAEQLHADRELAATPVLFYSATYSLQQAQAVAQTVGALDVLPKPGDPQTVLAMVDKALGVPSTRVPGRESGVSTGSFEPIPRDFARQLAELEVMTHRLATPIEMGLALAAERDPSKLLLGLARMSRELVGARYSSVGLLSEDGRNAHVVLSSGAGRPAGPNGAATPVLTGDPRIYPAPPPSSLLGELLRGARTVRLRNVETAQLCFPIADCSHVDSFLAVALLSDSAPRGWLFLANKLGGEEFTEGDARVLSTLAAQGGSTYERVQERMRMDQDLRKSKAMYEALFEAAPDVMLTTDQVASSSLQTHKRKRCLGILRKNSWASPLKS